MKNFNRNPEGNNQWEARSDAEVQRIIDQKPTWTKKDFRGEGKLLVLRIGGKIVGDSQRELSFVGKENTKRAISETMQWFNPKGKQ